MGFVLLTLLAGVCLAGSRLAAQTLPPGFRDRVIFSGLIQPTAVAFASDGRVFVAEKSGRIKVFASLSSTSSTVFADLRSKVHNYWDRGLLGLALHPGFPQTPYVYVLYAYDAAIGGSSPRWGPGDGTSDPCPTPPGGTGDGCVVSGRLSRLQANGSVMTGIEQVLIEDWFQQYPSHSIGSLVFGNDGALYASGGDGASFNFADYGQKGIPLNPGGDPPVPVGGTQTPPTAEGGALRSQDLRTSGDPVGLAGTVIRIDPETGAALPSNPLFADPDPNARRIVAQGLRNPFRMTTRPGTSEVWIGDVGWSAWEEINRIGSISTVKNFGWPCYEGSGRQSSYDNLNLTLCENLYAEAGAASSPVYSYNHASKVVAGEACGTGSSAITGLAFYGEGAYPENYRGALFFADYSRSCVWTMFPGTDGDPNPSDRQTFISGAGTPVQLTAGPGGDLFYVDIAGGKLHRVQYFTPTAVIGANPTAGDAPLNVLFDATGSTHPDPTETLTYSWDLDGDGSYGDSTSLQPTHLYESPGSYTVRLKVTDSHGGIDTESVVIDVSNSPPVPTIGSPAGGTTWRVGDVLSFSGSATDAGDGVLPDSALSWTLRLHHCPNNCHVHVVQTYEGTASGTFNGEDHEYPSHFELLLTATDSEGREGTASVLLQPQTATLSLASVPPGLQIQYFSDGAAAPFDRTAIVGSSNSIGTASPQVLGTDSWEFVSWSDGGARSHNVVAGTDPVTHTATFVRQPPLSAVSIDPDTLTGGSSATGTVVLSGPAPGSGALVALASSNTSIASVPGSVLIAAGQTSGTFPVTTAPVGSSTPVTINASYAAGNLGTTLTVTDAGPLPSPWVDQDVGAVGLAGSATFSSGTFTVQGSGAGIAGTSDQFHFAYQTLTGDGEIRARVTAVQNSTALGRAGVMIRDTLAPNSAYAMMLLRGDGRAFFLRRVSTGANSFYAQAQLSLPYWVRLVRSGNTFTAYRSSNGVSWTAVGSPVTIPMGSSVSIGLAVSSFNNAALNTSTFTNVTVTGTGPGNGAPVVTSPGNQTSLEGATVNLPISASDPNGDPLTWGATGLPPGLSIGATTGVIGGTISALASSGSPYTVTVTATDPGSASGSVGFTWTVNPSGGSGLPSPWVDQDLGAVGLAGSATFSSGTFTVQGSGAGIAGTSDQFHFAYQTLTGDGEIRARVTAVQNSTALGRAGVMIRDTLAPNSAYAMMLLRGDGWAFFLRRLSTGGTSSYSQTQVSVPHWVRLVRSGNTFTAYRSSNGVSWTALGTPVTIPMGASVSVGLAVSSFNNAALNTSTFTNVTVTGAP